jgi:glutamine amidotransferase
MICIVDYGMGNLLSVLHAFEMTGSHAAICRDPDRVATGDRIVLPGVGAFGNCIRNLRETGLAEALHEAVILKGRPTLGICLGMQAMACRSFEMGEHTGLGWFDADVTRLEPRDPSLRIPHVGWNDIRFREDSPLFRGIPTGADFYFVHSYRMKCHDEQDVEATCDYGGAFTCAVRKNNVFATQFHPEKSQDYGLRVLENFLNWKP